MRTTKTERRHNALQFYEALRQCKRAVVVIERSYNKNNTGCTARFKGVCSSLKGDPAIIAEGKALGKEECFFEFFTNINPIYPQRTCFDDGFKEWVKKNYGIRITYDDGYAMIWEM